MPPPFRNRALVERQTSASRAPLTGVRDGWMIAVLCAFGLVLVSFNQSALSADILLKRYSDPLSAWIE